MALHRSSPLTELARQRAAGSKRHRRPVSLPRLWSVIVGLFLVFFAFPPLAQACETLFLQVRGPDMARPGDSIVYTIKYKNLNWPLLTHVTLFSHIPEHTFFVSASPGCQLYDSTLVCYVGQLAEGEGGQVEMTLRVDEDAPADAVVKVEAVAVDREHSQKPKFLNYAWTRTKIVAPRLIVTKHPSADTVYDGELVTFTYVVTNTGNVALKNVVLVDDQKRPSQICDTVTKLRPGYAFTCTWATTLDADTTNVATATGLDPWGNPVTDTDSAFVNTVQQPGEDRGGIIALEKAASAEVVYIGDTVVYTYTVTNLSDDPAHDILLTDDKLGPIAGPFDLEAGGSGAFTTSTALMADTTNLATAVGYNVLGDAVMGTDSAFVLVAAPDVTLSLSLTADASRVYKGDTVSYTYVISNVSPDTAYNVALVEDQSRSIAGPFNLAGGASRAYAVNRMLDEDTTTAATATGEDRLGRLVADTASTFVDTIQRPGPDGEGIIVLTVNPSETSVEAGTVVTYTYVVTNVSQDVVCQVVIYDDPFGYITTFRPSANGVGAQDAPYNFCLQGGESRTAIIPLPLDQTTGNTAVATGLDLLMTEVLAEATAFVDVFVVEPPGEHVVFLPLVSKNGP